MSDVSEGCHAIGWSPLWTDVAMAYLPGTTVEEAGYVLWNYTGYPSFGSPKDFLDALWLYRIAATLGCVTCYGCGGVYDWRWNPESIFCAPCHGRAMDDA